MKAWLVRRHDNVDYLEPVTPVVFLALDAARPPTLAAVVYTSAGAGDGLRVRPGDRVTAEHRQPNGSALTATVTIRQ